MPEGHDATIEVCNIMSFVLYTQILKQFVLKPASPGITLKREQKAEHMSWQFEGYMLTRHNLVVAQNTPLEEVSCKVYEYSVSETTLYRCVDCLS